MSKYKHTYKTTIKREAHEMVDGKKIVKGTVVGVAEFQKLLPNSARLLDHLRQEADRDALQDAESRQNPTWNYTTVFSSSEGSKVHLA